MDLESWRYLYLRRVVGTALGAVGLDAADFLARRIGRRVYDLHGPGGRRALARVQSWLGSAGGENRAGRLVRRMYEHYARFWIEALYHRRLLRDSSWRRFVRIEGERELVALRQEMGACLYLTPYYGNIGVLAAALGRLEQPVHVVADRLDHPALRAWQHDLYHDRHVRIIDRREAVRSVPRVMEMGGSVLMVAEGERRRGRAIETPFLGRTLRLYPTIGRLVKWFAAPILPVTCRRLDEPFRFEVRWHGTLTADAGEREERIVHACMGSLEGAVAIDPAQYLWSIATLSEAPAGIADDPAAVRRMGSGSVSFPRTRRRTWGWRSRSAVDRSPAGSVAAVGPAPRA